MNLEKLSAVTIKATLDKQLSAGFETTVRQAVSRWADGIPHHGIADLGNAITIRSMKSISVCRAAVDTMYQERSVAAETYPYQGEKYETCTITAPDQVNIWDYESKEVAGFVADTEQFPILHSRRIRVCDHCNGEKTITCTTCGGKGQHTCSRCSGKGEKTCDNCGGNGKNSCTSCGSTGVVNCFICSGSGHDSEGKTCYNCGGHGNKHCSNCAGTGEIRCNNCNGSGRKQCFSCGGKGIVRCEPCKGSGRIVCPVCEGTGAMVDCLVMTINFSPSSQNVLRAASPISERLTNLMQSTAASEQLWQETIDSPLGQDVSKAISPAELREQYDNLQTALLSRETESLHVTRQRLTIETIPCCEVKYTHENHEYVLWVYGTDTTVHAIESPITARADSFVEDAKRFFAANALTAAYKLAGHAKQMYDSGPKKESAQNIYKLVSAKMYRQYIIVVTASAAAAAFAWSFAQALLASRTPAAALTGAILPFVGWSIAGFLIGNIVWSLGNLAKQAIPDFLRIILCLVIGCGVPSWGPLNRLMHPQEKQSLKSPVSNQPPSQEITDTYNSNNVSSNDSTGAVTPQPTDSTTDYYYQEIK